MIKNTHDSRIHIVKIHFADQMSQNGLSQHGLSTKWLSHNGLSQNGWPEPKWLEPKWLSQNGLSQNFQEPAGLNHVFLNAIWNNLKTSCQFAREPLSEWSQFRGGVTMVIRRSTGSNQVLFCTGHGTKAFPILLTRAVLNLAWPSSTAGMMPCSDGLSLATWIVHCSQNSFGMSRPWKQYGGTWIWSFKQCVNFATGCKRGVTG